MRRQLWQLFAQAVTIFSAAAVVAAVFMHVMSKPSSYRDAVSRVLPSVVSITGRDEDGADISIGSGVVISRDGHILTNYHLIANAGKIKVGVSNGDFYVPELIGIAPEIDIAVLRINAADLPPAISAAEDGDLEPGDIVFAIGNPFGLNRSTTMGIVSAIGRDRLGLHGVEQFIQTDAAINPGNSGGALANADGKLVGINSALFYRQHGIMPQGIGFAVPAGIAMDAYGQLVGGAAAPAKGAQLRGLSPRLREEVFGNVHSPIWLQAMLVTRVWRGSAAAAGGLQVGDVVLRINDSSPQQYIEKGALLPDAQRLEVRRGNEEFVLNLR